MAAPIPSPRPDALTGNGGNAYTGAAGDASGGDSNCGTPAPVENGPGPNEQAAHESYSDDPKTYIGRPKGKPKGSKPKNAKPKVHAVHTGPESDNQQAGPSNIVYVAGNGGDATSGPGGQAIGGPANASSGTQNIDYGSFDDSNDFIDVDALNSSLNDASVLNGALGHDNGRFFISIRSPRLF
ncbi:hypothetical protein FRC00_007408 [Tulasnella sp. 408]|nr:hypothetical protein FRC00_007408 [Tulasnella sp. 408]